ncbi:MAG: TRAP transporter large permease subunit [Deltaproteobacteria bacterium]|nr:MAG: TRAP transporter large permease subunit [Deltaproteobacteria bacterium]
MIAAGLTHAPLLAELTQFPDAGLPSPLIPIVGLGLLLLGAPLYVVIGGLVVTLFGVYPNHPDPFGVDFHQNFDLTGSMVDLINTPELVAIPFFMVAGTVMGRGEIANRLVRLASALLGWLPGGLAVSAIGACVFFAAISGSSPVTVVTIGAIMVPALKAAGYSDRLSHGVVTAAGGLGIIIPPSIPMVVFAIYATMSGSKVKLDDIFIAGLGPGALIGLLLAVYVILSATTKDKPVALGKRALFALLFVVASAAGVALFAGLASWLGSTVVVLLTLIGVFTFAVRVMGVEGIWSVLMPIVIIAGIYSGIFNAIEASAVSVVLAIVIEVFIHRSLKLYELPALLRETAVLMGSLLLIITVSLGLALFMEDKHVPEAVGAWLRSFDLTPLSFALLLNLLLLVVGCFLDIISAIVLFVPLVVPIAAEMGLDPIHVGLIFIVNLEIGYLTPPLGINLFVAATYFKKPLGFIVRSVAPFLAVMLLSVGLITYVPSISLGVVRVQQGLPFWVDFPTELPTKEELDEKEETMQDMMQDEDVQKLLDSLDDGGDPDTQKLLEELENLDGTELEGTDEPPPDDDDEELEEPAEDPESSDDLAPGAEAVAPDAGAATEEPDVIEEPDAVEGPDAGAKAVAPDAAGSGDAAPAPETAPGE